MRAKLCLLAALFTSLPAAADMWDIAGSAVHSKDYERALLLLKPLAARGNAQAEGELGRLYAGGAGVEKNLDKAIRWATLSAKQGNANGEALLGALLDAGVKGPKGSGLAGDWLKRAALQGFSDAQDRLGSLYFEGRGGVPKDLTLAAYWYFEAAEQGDPDGEKALASMYWFGHGVHRNFAEALQWYAKTDEQLRTALGAVDLSSSSLDLTPLCPTPRTEDPAVGPPPASLGLSPFYAKYIDAKGIPVVGSAKVCDRSLQLAYRVLGKELSGPIHAALVAQGARIAIFSDLNGETLTTLPEEVLWTGRPEFPEQRCGGGAVRGLPIATVCESNLLAEQSFFARLDQFRGRENVLIHEIAHTIQHLAFSPEQASRVEAAYLSARHDPVFLTRSGESSYMMTDAYEFFAVGTAIWFSGWDPDSMAAPSGIKGRGDLQKYAPELYAVLSEVYPGLT